MAFTPTRPSVSALVATVGLLAALASGCVPARAADSDQSKRTVSRELAKPLTEARADIESGKLKEAIGKLTQADADPHKSPWDQHVINELLLYAYVKTNDYAKAAQAMESTIGDGFTEPAQVNDRIKELARIHYQLNDYTRALQYAQRALQGGFADEATSLIAGESYYQKSDFQNARLFTNTAIEREVRQGEVPKETELVIVLNSCIKLDDPPCTTQALERLVTWYSKPEYWQRLIDVLYRLKPAQSNDADMLNIYRLANEVGAIRRPEDYTEMAQLALEQGAPGEARQVLEKGFAQNVFNDRPLYDRNQRLLEKAKSESASDLAQLPKLEREASATGGGNKDVAVGVAYLSYQQYDKAVRLLQRGLDKGRLKNPIQVQLLLGIAEFKSGDRTSAVKTFRGVKGDDPVIARLASLWSVHVGQ